MRGWGVLDGQGNRGMSYRFRYDPKRDSCMTIPIISLHALREGIVDQSGFPPPLVKKRPKVPRGRQIPIIRRGPGPCSD